MSKDSASDIAFNPAAPEPERFDAQAELQKANMPSSADLIPKSELLPLIQYIQQAAEEEDFAKSLTKPNVVPFPSTAIQNKRPGMQSVYLNDMQIALKGDYFERPGAFSFDTMRYMVDSTPILSSIIMRRQRQIARFCRAQENGRGYGFQVRLRDPNAQAGEDEKASIAALQDFFSNCGWEYNARASRRLRRDKFPALMQKLVRDSLVLDSCPIETQYKVDRALGIDGFYAVDGATIRLCSEDGYREDEDLYAIQMVDGQIRAAYTFDDLIYVPRNPRSDVNIGGYGMSETELLVRTVTGFLNAMTYNNKFFDSNSIPKGMLHLSGNYSERDINSFKRQWNAMVKGVNNSWALPVMVSQDQESRVAFEKFGVEVNEMMFGKWMTFLASMICAIYGIGPDEINFESFSASRSSLSGSDTEAKLTDSRDNGLLPILSYFESMFTDYIVSDFSDKYVFRWTGLDEADEKQLWEERKLTMTVNELRALRSTPAIEEDWGSAPINPSLIGVWQQAKQAKQQDFGQQEPGADKPPQGEDFGQGEEDYGSAQGGQPDPADGEPAESATSEATAQQQPDMAKALDFGLPALIIEV